MKKILIAFLLLFSAVPVFTVNAAQTIRITGRVLEAKDKQTPVIGAYLVQETTKYHADTDDNGKFTLEIYDPQYPINVTSIGFKTYTFRASNSEMQTYNIYLTEDREVIDAAVSVDCGADKNKGILERKMDKATGNCYVTNCVNDGNWKKIGDGTNAYCGRIINCNAYMNQFNATKMRQKNQYPTADVPASQWPNYCYPTDCKEPQYTKEGSGKNLKCTSTAGNSCKITHAKSAAYDANGKCLVQECDDNFEKSDDSTACNPCKCGTVWNASTKKCRAWTEPEKKCTKTSKPPLPDNATEATKVCTQKGDIYCLVINCADMYRKTADQKKCDVDEGATCTPTDKANASTGTVVKKNGKAACKPTCKYSTYEARLIDGDFKCVLAKDRMGTNCKDEEIQQLKADGKIDQHAKTGKVSDYDDTTGTVRACTVESCDSGFHPVDNKCVPDDQSGKSCPPDKLKDQDPNATRGTIRKQNDTTGEVEKCEVTHCTTGYEPDKTNLESGFDYPTKCIASKCTICGQKWNTNTQLCESELGKPCTSSDTNVKSAVWACTSEDENGTEFCRVTGCISDDYTISTDEQSCVSNSGKDCLSSLPAGTHATTASWQSGSDGTLTCVIDSCESMYNLVNGACQPKNVLSPADREARMNELTANAQKAKENENSLINKTIDAVGIGATGIGTMMLASAISEQKSDADAERDMRAYLETFRCEYAKGKSIKGGETDVELPGGNDMVDLHTQYATLAKDLKDLKEALGLKPGIESEVVINKEDTGLYNDVGTGVTGGAYASIARALRDPDGEDAKMWNLQKEKTKKNLTAGAITAGVGAVGSLAANLIVNSGKDNQENSRDILANYERKKTPYVDNNIGSAVSAAGNLLNNGDSSSESNQNDENNKPGEETPNTPPPTPEEKPKAEVEAPAEEAANDFDAKAFEHQESNKMVEFREEQKTASGPEHDINEIKNDPAQYFKTKFNEDINEDVSKGVTKFLEKSLAKDSQAYIISVDKPLLNNPDPAFNPTWSIKVAYPSYLNDNDAVTKPETAINFCNEMDRSVCPGKKGGCVGWGAIRLTTQTSLKGCLMSFRKS